MLSNKKIQFSLAFMDGHSLSSSSITKHGFIAPPTGVEHEAEKSLTPPMGSPLWA